MNWIEALLLGLIQGLTEYLPVSSSGHLAIGSYLFGVEGEENLAFTVAVHVATVLSTLVVLWKEVAWIFTGMFRWDGKMNDEQKYVVNILISMIPVGIVGLFFKDQIEALFAGEVIKVVGCSLLVTAALLTMTHFYVPKEKEQIYLMAAEYVDKKIDAYMDAFVRIPLPQKSMQEVLLMAMYDIALGSIETRQSLENNSILDKIKNTY